MNGYHLSVVTPLVRLEAVSVLSRHPVVAHVREPTAHAVLAPGTPSRGTVPALLAVHRVEREAAGVPIQTRQDLLL